jgi:hypothetical protein
VCTQTPLPFRSTVHTSGVTHRKGRLRAQVGEPPSIHGVVGIGADVTLPLLEELAPGQVANHSITPTPLPVRYTLHTPCIQTVCI